MKSLRPLAGALLATLMLVAAVPAVEIDIIGPGGGNAALTPPRTDPTPPRDEPDRSLPTEPDTPRAESRPRDSDNPSPKASSEPGLQTRHFGAQVELSCAVGDRPNALTVVNQSHEPLPPGTRIKWQLKAEGLQGFFRLRGQLDGGASLVADNVLKKQVGNGGICVARVI